MNIMYFEPLGRAWNRMKLALFKPFDLNKWLIVGFNAFLAGLLDGHNWGSGSRAGGGDDLGFGEFLRLPQRGWEWVLDHPGWFIGILFILFFVICLVVLITWLSSRGTIMFIDSVALNRAEIAKPWREKSMEGNSLFLWRLVFGLLTFTGIILILAVFFRGASYLYDTVHPGHVPVFFISAAPVQARPHHNSSLEPFYPDLQETRITFYTVRPRVVHPELRRGHGYHIRRVDDLLHRAPDHDHPLCGYGGDTPHLVHPPGLLPGIPGPVRAGIRPLP
jgi:hypothetical protein